ncbi:fumarylacetoacetate hydrolase family protein [Pararhodobacter sp. SW119]|uniref:fumarylacetoacetate hydrolase family protein n=1 Tax=Pararhodobacter sp. SW119 TaxID=2780075 RepID=UPI001ADFF11C|nr:fumarylacetoacetate hydrolase family protein [Pararhodobacter sp. SW119]
MHFVTFTHDGCERAGILLGEAEHPEDTILDLAHPAYREAMQGTEPRMLAMIGSGLHACATRLADVEPPASARLRVDAVRLCAPLPNPPRIFGAAHNFTCALEERGMECPDEPVVFAKAPSTIAGPGADILLPAVGGCTYEAELAAVIGKRCSEVGASEALDHVAGYMIFNDISASEIIRAEGNFQRGKNFPTFGPCGPFLATADEIPDPQDLDIELRVDDVIRQRGSTRMMLFNVAQLVSILSQTTELHPGDMIATGTPAGVAAVQKPPNWLQAGQRVSIRITGLGSLVNQIVAEEAANA